VAGRALRHRNFQLFFKWTTDFVDRHVECRSVGAVVAGLPLTGSALLLGSVGFASQIPVFSVCAVGTG